MGVSGCGKSSLGQALAHAMGAEFIEGDRHHPSENVARMAAGVPLTDADRAGWLATLADLLTKARQEGRPVVLPVDADAAELFVAVAGAPGRYCLQPADARGSVLAAEASAFVEVVRPVRPFSRDP